MKKIAALTLTTALVSSLTFSSAFAFTDVEEGQAAAISALQERGIVSGIDKDHFVPKGKISYAQTVQMIVKGMNLNMDTLRFFKQPLASDIYTNIPNDAWYADAFIIAHYNGMNIPKDVNPNATITREQFGEMLVRALEKKGNFPLVKMFIPIKDEAQITPEFQGALQRLLLYKIAELDKDGMFNPKAELTRGQAAGWVYNAIRVLDTHIHKPAPIEDVTVTVEKVTDDVNKVTLSRGQKPNSGYSIAIQNVRFDQNGQAVISYTLQDPKPDTMYAEVITEAKAVTYVSSAYKAVAEPAVAN
ncbi:S-layer homology domain-containing protein [Paenibacillus alginolyticus]|uniref:S-layer homology domain-containing protein n=1 Tax=Paenibacillus alginolyticus TaxID=59839 RepID=A0ABT4G699_9BACL|nr:S-layer homology domain-containing protein [Paenibacillus alginolyticus]MCY9691708.1 S-layer homology domain-containing protein [Paenibacillus alginolyticus]MEC0144058.1 S-layer homology domain-containing protein [Paenibacillus alginolyticus]